MKITEVKNKAKVQETIDWRKLDLGTVIEFMTGAKAVVMRDANDRDRQGLLLLVHGGGANNLDYYETASGYKSVPVARIIGKIEEIIVKEQLI